MVVPREGFRQAPSCLKRLLEFTDTPFRLIYVDGNSPGRIEREIRRLMRGSGGTLIRTDEFVRPTYARNLAFRQVTTRYTVFLDNDVLVTPAWLESLVQAAEDTGAAYVSPIICIGARNPPIVHVAGGVNELVREGENVRLVSRSDHARRQLPDALPEIAPQATTMAEFDAILIRSEVLRSLGGLDEGCSTAFEHNDFCLTLAARGYSGWLDPNAVVDYAPDAAGAPGNAAYHLVRWSRQWIDESRDVFVAKWGLLPDDPNLNRDLSSLNQRRHRPINYLRAIVRRLLGESALKVVDRCADSSFAWVFRDALNRRQPSAKVIQMPGLHE